MSSQSPKAAAVAVARMKAAWQTLASTPRISATGLIPATRRLLVGGYVLTVRITGDVVEIAAIRHGRQRDAHAPAGAAGEA